MVLQAREVGAKNAQMLIDDNNKVAAVCLVSGRRCHLVAARTYGQMFWVCNLLEFLARA